MKILIVDDSKVTRKFIGRCIRQAGLGAHDIEEAENGLEALKRVAELAPDLVVTDWNMPHMTGIDFLHQLRSSGSQVNVGFITSEGTDVMRHQAKEGGARFFITKPFTPESVRDALQQVLP
ncbi:MAG: response regulator [Archangiaceae bacterium]|nr:response regulator [Archangiaceae bacterium]